MLIGRIIDTLLLLADAASFASAICVLLYSIDYIERKYKRHLILCQALI